MFIALEKWILLAKYILEISKINIIKDHQGILGCMCSDIPKAAFI